MKAQGFILIDVDAAALNMPVQFQKPELRIVLKPKKS
jgi:hypothetical protein